ncbi:MAG: putative sulfate exporter family transporter [Pseudomonadota bacterium]|uniref:YeiH family protein n=1 Tax=Polaromonas sp. TaxID=1869339 RepID=UPI001846DC22|nr:putative sulfate exporter family transporter [Polaromonas sp.]MBA3593343.1 putative sulfate exporter family transporter [Polaromonas sp.]MDQ3271571.1 putative sulfate exporter family transporter [Pseudomonadota bacterium]
MSPGRVIGRWRTQIGAHFPGVLVCGVIALAATFVSEHYGGPQLLYALLIGLAFHFLNGDPRVVQGINFCGRTVLRVGVALLGARITFGQVAELGLQTAMLMVLAVVLTIVFGLLLARWLGCARDEGVLTGSAVAICGASAALAVSSVLPQTRENERFTLLAVVGVTVLSTVAMVIYPFSLNAIGLTPAQAGIVLGGSIHDVAQVVAAGMMLGPQAGDTATLVKLFRVMLLMPVVLVIAVLYRKHPGVKTPDTEVPLIPGFLLAFIVLVMLASVGTITPDMTRVAGDASRWMLVTAIAAAGVKTSFQDLLKLGWKPVALLLGETVFIVALVVAGVLLMGLGQV